MWILPLNHPQLSAFVPEDGCSRKDLSELSDLLGSRLTWRSKHFAYSTWSQRWRRVWWIRCLFGRILEPSLHEAFTERYTASLADIHVNHSALPAECSGETIPDTFGRIYETASKQLNLFGAGSRMLNNTSSWDSIPFTESWQTWVMQLRQEYTARLNAAQHMTESDYLYLQWITLTASDGEKTPQVCYRSNGGHYVQRKSGRYTAKLSDQVMLYSGQVPRAGTKTFGRKQEQLNPAWAAQLMGTTLEQTFFGCLETESLNIQLN